MLDWQVHEVTPGVVAEVIREMPPISDTLETEVSRIWSRACRDVPSLFNGRVFSVDKISPDRLAGHWTEYRRVLAQLRVPALYEGLRVRSLAVFGALLCADGLVFGQRNPDAVYLPGWWQLPPAGNVDVAAQQGNAIDLKGQLLRELDEELGLPAECVTAMHPVCAVEHAGTHVLDLGYVLKTPLDEPAVRAAHATSRDRELVALKVVPRRDLQSAMAAMTPLMPSASLLLRQLGLPDLAV
jgi:8-oxo-dGTP pyrophosphatase MutT (NUDIX family)